MSIGRTPIGAPRRREFWTHGSYSGRVGYVSVVAELVIIPLLYKYIDSRVTFVLRDVSYTYSCTTLP